MGLLSDRELAGLLPAETHAFAGPIPTQSVSSDEFMPVPQTLRQRRVESRVKALGGALAKRHGMTRRRFLTTASGMAAAFLAMNEVYGALYDVSAAEAQTPEMAKERADGLAKQFVMDCHTHFLRDDTRIMGFVRQREAVGKTGWNPALRGKEQTIEDLKFANYYKEVFLDSDTKVALLSGAPPETPASRSAPLSASWPPSVTPRDSVSPPVCASPASGPGRLLCAPICTTSFPAASLDTARGDRPEDQVKKRAQYPDLASKGEHFVKRVQQSGGRTRDCGPAAGWGGCAHRPPRNGVDPRIHPTAWPGGPRWIRGSTSQVGPVPGPPDELAHS